MGDNYSRPCRRRFCSFLFSFLLLLLLLIRMKKKIRTTAATMKSIMNRWCIERVCELLGSEASRRHYLDIFLMYEITKICVFSDISNTAKNEIEMDMDIGQVRSGQVR